MRIIFTLYLMLSFMMASAQNNYDASLISKDLLPYASAVVRDEEITTEVKDVDNVFYHVKRVITVLNKNGDDIAHMAVFYNKKTAVKYIKGYVYNEFGKLTGKFNQSDFSDQSAISNSSLFEDERVKHYIPAVTQYPYTIAYEYELKYKQTLNIPYWTPNPETNLAVENSSYTFICKPDFNIRYKEFNLPSKVVLGTNKDGYKTYKWQIANMKAFKDEPFSPDWRRFLTCIFIAPQKFSYYGIEGSFTDWQQLGKWVYDKLLANRTAISVETADHIKQITADFTDPKLKAKKIYEYMQSKTHYISVQVGIGGYQPFMASDVDNQNYGDCKALVNYTQALLKVVNIDSYYCVVKAGRAHKVSLMNDFASMEQGDHVILCIPFKNDTTWLECTSQRLPFGYLSDFTDDRTVLACTPDGGKLLHTPKYTLEGNLEKRKAEFIINDTGTLSGYMETLFEGTDYDNRDWVISDAPTERIKDIKRIYPINNLEIGKLAFVQDKTTNPATTEKIKFSADEYASISDNKLYFSINSVNRQKALREIRNRVNPVNINRGYTEEDEIAYSLPPGYRLENEPLKIALNKPFGSFNATFTLAGNKLVYKRRFQIKDGDYNKDTYQEMVDFYQAVADADNYIVALAKTTN